MTICIGILCDSSKAVVLAADRMVTGGDVEFEQELHKIEPINDRCVMLSSGNALRQLDLLRNVKGCLSSQRQPSVKDVVAELKKQYADTRREKAEELHLQPLGLNFDRFIKQQASLPEHLSLRLTHNIEKESLGVSLLVAGTDGDGAHLYYVYDPGTSDCFDTIGYCSIGSGERHADLTCMLSTYSIKMPLNRAIFLAYQAKRDSEVAPGVGSRYTDLGVVDEKGFRFLHQTVLDSLKSLYDELRGVQEKERPKLHARIDALEMKSAEN